MLNTIRIIVIIAGGLSLLAGLMDMYHIANIKLNNKLKAAVYLTYAVCAVFFSIDGFISWYRG